MKFIYFVILILLMEAIVNLKNKGSRKLKIESSSHRTNKLDFFSDNYKKYKGFTIYKFDHKGRFYLYKNRGVKGVLGKGGKGQTVAVKKYKPNSTKITSKKYVVKISSGSIGDYPYSLLSKKFPMFAPPALSETERKNILAGIRKKIQNFLNDLADNNINRLKYLTKVGMLRNCKNVMEIYDFKIFGPNNRVAILQEYINSSFSATNINVILQYSVANFKRFVNTLLEAVHCFHEQYKMIHLDIKPDNFMIRKLADANNSHAILIDIDQAYTLDIFNREAVDMEVEIPSTKPFVNETFQQWKQNKNSEGRINHIDSFDQLKSYKEDEFQLGLTLGLMFCNYSIRDIYSKITRNDCNSLKTTMFRNDPEEFKKFHNLVEGLSAETLGERLSIEDAIKEYNKN